MAVDLFCGVGGLSFGFQKAGIYVAAGYDIDPECRFAYSTNCNVAFECRDVATLTCDDLQQHFTDAEFTVLAGCAPCQPFSTYARTRTSDDERWQLLDAFAEHVKSIRPDVVTMENVPQLHRHVVFNLFARSLKQSGYWVDWSVVECLEFGVPQSRKRLVLLASLHGPFALLRPRRRRYTSVRSAIGALPALSAGEECRFDPLHRSCALSELNLRRIKASRPGGSWRDWDDKLLAACHRRESGQTYPSVYGRMTWNEPAPTITTQFFGYGNGRFGHPEQHRALSLREGAILQTFPKKYRFEPDGERLPAHKLGRLIGNAVPPALADSIGRSIVVHARGVAQVP